MPAYSYYGSLPNASLGIELKIVKMPYSSTVNLSIDNDLQNLLVQYICKVYYSQRNDSVLAGFDAYDSTVSFDVSGIYGEVFIEVFLSSVSNTFWSHRVIY